MGRTLSRLLFLIAVALLPSCGWSGKSTLIYWNGSPAYTKKSATLKIGPFEAEKRLNQAGGRETTAIVDDCYYALSSANAALEKLGGIGREGLFLDGNSGRIEYRWGFKGAETLEGHTKQTQPERLPEFHYTGSRPVRTHSGE